MIGRSAFALFLVGIAALISMPAKSAVTERVCLQQIEVDFSECAAADDAVAACASAVKAQPADFNARASLCEAYLANREYDAAIEVLNAGEAVHRGDNFTLRLIGRMLSNVEEEQSASQARPPDLDTLVNYMVLRCNTIKDLEECDKVLEIDPNNFKALAGRGDILLMNGELVGAILAYRQSLAIEVDQPEVATKLATVEEQRNRQVVACLAAASSSGIMACRNVLLPGEDDTYDIYSKIGSLELRAGAIDRAQGAYESADAAQFSQTSGDMVNILTIARRCLDTQDAPVCSQAVITVPVAEIFLDVRAQVTLTGCRALMPDATDDDVDEARAVCEEARRLNQSGQVAQEIEQLLAAAVATVPDVPEPAPEPPPGPTLTEQCNELIARNAPLDEAIEMCERAVAAESDSLDLDKLVNDIDRLRASRAAGLAIDNCEDAAAGDLPGDALVICRNAAQLSQGDTSRARLDSIVAELEFDALAGRCNDAETGSDAAAACRDAITLAPDDTDRRAVEQRLEQLERQIASAANLTVRRERCINFDSALLAAARADCISALEEVPDDPDLRRSWQSVELLIAAYRNEPLFWSQGNEAITY